MSELKRIETQLKEIFEGEAWHGPAVLEVIRAVTAKAASAHPISTAHSIWEIVLHVTATYKLVLRRIEGNDAQLTPEQDWPKPPSPTESNWKAAVDSLRQTNRQLRQAVVRFNARKLGQPLVGKPPYSAYTQFIGITQHDAYHAGQIALLKKGLR